MRDVEILPWNSERDPLPAIPGVEGVINLLGEPIARGRWTHAKMMRILDSRVNGTRNLVTGLKKKNSELLAENKPLKKSGTQSASPPQSITIDDEE